MPVHPNEEPTWFYLNDMLYAPELHPNLISTSTLLEAGLHVMPDTSGAVIWKDSAHVTLLVSANVKEMSFGLVIDVFMVMV
ncbi:hypothetical protein FRC08_016074 [Ceratobasidium sp. 394]|nr:hypothetical protein FRC08_016074 [Ceratobasidium sp. 394]